MSSGTAATVITRMETIEALAASLPRRASLVSRLLQRYAGQYASFDLNPAHGGILVAVDAQPRRITELAEMEGQAQPYVTKLVSDLEARGWVRRARDEADGRVVWVHLTDAGREALRDVRLAVSTMFSERLSRLSDQELESLAEADKALLLLIDTLQQAVSR